MSGGEYEYAYSRVGIVADEIAEHEPITPLRAAFVAHLRLVAKALHDIEWVDSCDMSPGEEEAAIRAVLAVDQPVT